MKIEDIKTIAEPVLEARNLFLVDLKLSKDNTIELFIDSLNGVNIHTCIEISREIESCLDREKEDFGLTVSSAGIGYPFKVNGQFQKNLDKTVEIKLKDNTHFCGLLKSFNEESVTLEVEEKKLVEGSKKKQPVRTEKTIQREEIREIKDVIKF